MPEITHTTGDAILHGRRRATRRWKACKKLKKIYSRTSAIGAVVTPRDARKDENSRFLLSKSLVEKHYSVTTIVAVLQLTGFGREGTLRNSPDRCHSQARVGRFHLSTLAAVTKNVRTAYSVSRVVCTHFARAKTCKL